MNYNVGYTGPAGGNIFYDNPNHETDGWRYLEAAPIDTIWHGKPWGGQGTLVGTGDTWVGKTGFNDIGKGASNTQAIVEKYGDREPSKNREYYAAKLCDDFDYGGHNDWFLPSKAEAEELIDSGIPLIPFGNWFVEYWTSTEGLNYGASSNPSDPAIVAVNASSFGSNAYSKDSTGGGLMVRAVRSFEVPDLVLSTPPPDSDSPDLGDTDPPAPAPTPSPSISFSPVVSFTPAAIPAAPSPVAAPAAPAAPAPVAAAHTASVSSPETAAVTSQSIAAPTAEAVASLQASLSAAQESLANNAANMSEQQVALAEMDIAVSEAALSVMNMALNGEGSLEECLDCYENALAQFEDAVNMGLLDDAQIKFLSEILNEIADQLARQGVAL